MPTICRFAGIRICMYANDHPPPHFHINHAGVEARFSIHTLDVMEGYVDPSAAKLVRSWAYEHQRELLDNWERVENNQPLNPIAPPKGH